MGEYFGTDGIRGVAGDLLTPEFAVQVGRAAAVVLAQKAGPHPLFVIGRDTRLSGPMLEAALTAGLTSGGARVEIAGGGRVRVHRGRLVHGLPHGLWVGVGQGKGGVAPRWQRARCVSAARAHREA